MNELIEKVGKRLPYSESPSYVDNLVEQSRINALAQAPSRKRQRVRRLWLTAASAAAVVALVATVALRLAFTAGYGQEQLLCSVETVEQSAPLSEVLASMTDEQLADIAYFPTDDIPEY